MPYEPNYNDPSQLPTAEELLIKVEYSNLERFILHHLGFQYDIPAKEECLELKQYSIDGELSQDELDDFDVLSKAKRKASWRLRLILQVLCQRKLIKPGTYLINIDW